MIENVAQLIGALLASGLILLIVAWLWGVLKTNVFLQLANYISSNNSAGKAYFYLLNAFDNVLKYIAGIVVIGLFLWFILNAVRTRTEQW